MGRKRRGVPINGIILLDKPSGVTSNGILQRVKHMFKAQKAGHTGALDPMASGLLPLCFGEATKVSAYLLDADKRYELRCKFGEQTDTADADGTVVAEKPADHIELGSLETACGTYLGEYDQLPPMYSALRVNGQRLYELARQGIEVERKRRRITIFDLNLTRFTKENEVGLPEAEMSVHCSKGTYIRTLVEDIAGELDTYAHLTMLRRTTLGIFTEPRMYTIDELEALHEEGRLADALIPSESAITNWPYVDLDMDATFYVRQGNPVQFIGNAGTPDEGLVRMRSEEGEFLGIGEILEDGRIGPRRLIRESEENPN